MTRRDLPVRRSRPSSGDAEKTDVVDDLPPADIEHGLVRLADEERTHGVEARIPDGLAVLMGALVSHKVRYFLQCTQLISNILSKIQRWKLINFQRKIFVPTSIGISQM